MAKKQKDKPAQGRKSLPDDDKRIRVVVFIEKRKIIARGGEDAMKKHLYNQA